MKAPFDIDVALARIAEAIRPFPRAGMFALAEEGYGSPFELLVACLISIRTKDEVMVPAARELFQLARTPAEMAKLEVAQIEAVIRQSTFSEAKAPRLKAIAEQIVKDHGGDLPADYDALVALHGVGPKCAGLVVGIAGTQQRIGVDIHVHRVTNRWGYVEASTPEKSLAALEEKLPPKWWVPINSLLVPFGKHICTGHRPFCSKCPVLDMCAQVGVERPR